MNESETIVESYVLFQQSHSAFRAIRNGIMTASQLQQIVPADTWHQPDSWNMWNEIHPNKDFILKLNDDCLFEIFKYLDLDALVQMANVCTKFKDLLNEFYFPKFKTHTIFVFHASLKVVRQTMKCIGPHLVHLYLRYQNYDDSTANYNQSEYEERVTYKVLQNIGKSLKRLTVRKPQGRKPSSKLFDLFVPALCQITFLEWDAEFNCDTVERLRDLCPYLETLVLKKRIFECHNNHKIVNLHWPTLKSIETFQYMSAMELPCQQFFEKFIQSNAQLKQLKLTNVNDNLFKVVTKYAPNLEYLEMLQNFDLCGIHFESTLHLLDSLKQLKIFVIRVQTIDNLSVVENQIKCLSQMKQLKLIVLLHNYSPSVWPPEQFPFAHYFSDILIEGNQMKLRIGDNATNIDFFMDKTTLVNIINSNNPHESSYSTLQQEIQTLFEFSTRYFPQCKQMITFENTDCYQHIHVSSTL